MTEPLSAEEHAELETIVALTSEWTLLRLRGMFAALAVVPRVVMPQEWLPAATTRKAPATEEKMSRLTELLSRLYNGDVEAAQKDAASGCPWEKKSDFNDWMEGYLQGVALGLEDKIAEKVMLKMARLSAICHAEGLRELTAEGVTEYQLRESVPELLRANARLLARGA